MQNQPITLLKLLEWIAATIVVAATTVFAVMKFAYSDFDTQRTNDIYRSQIDQRFDGLQTQLHEINNKVDRLLENGHR